MQIVRCGVFGLALMVSAGAAAWCAPQSDHWAEAGSGPETLTVDLLTDVPATEADDLSLWFPAMIRRTKEEWLKTLPASARPPLSKQGEVRIVLLLHRDGRISDMTMERPSGDAALDRAAWAAITGSAPYAAFPAGATVSQIRLRFVLNYNHYQENDRESSGPVSH